MEKNGKKIEKTEKKKEPDFVKNSKRVS